MKVLNLTEDEVQMLLVYVENEINFFKSYDWDSNEEKLVLIDIENLRSKLLESL